MNETLRSFIILLGNTSYNKCYITYGVQIAGCQSGTKSLQEMPSTGFWLNKVQAFRNDIIKPYHKVCSHVVSSLIVIFGPVIRERQPGKSRKINV